MRNTRRARRLVGIDARLEEVRVLLEVDRVWLRIVRLRIEKQRAPSMHEVLS